MARIIHRGLVVPDGRKDLQSEFAIRASCAVALFAVLMLAAALLVPMVAMAAEASTAPAAGGELDLQTWPDSGQLIVVTAVTVPESVKLPTVVRIPVPAGATVQWAGEILGGELSADPARTYKLVDSPVGGRYAELTIEQTRTAQVDSALPAPTVAGEQTSASFEWIQSVDSPLTSFSVRVPAAASDVKISPKPAGQPETNSAGESLYSGAPTKLEPGKKQTVEFSYSTGAPTPAAAGGNGIDSLIFAIAAALVVAVIALVVVLARQRQGTTTPPPAPARSRPSSTRAGQAEPKSSEPPAPNDDDWGFDDTE